MDAEDIIDLTVAVLQPSLGRGCSPNSEREDPEAAARGAALNPAAAGTMEEDEDVLLTEEIGQVTCDMQPPRTTQQHASPVRRQQSSSQIWLTAC